VVTDLGVAYWLTPTSARFDRNRSRLIVTGEFGYLRALGDRDAAGVTVGATLYNRQSDYAALGWFYPTVGGSVMARWDRWVIEDLALRAGLGATVLGSRQEADIAFPGLQLELGARWAGRVGATLRMERQRLNAEAVAFPALPGFTYPLGNPGTSLYRTSTTRTDWYVGVTTHGWTGLAGVGAATLLAAFSALGFSS
jgi:hypothetical protein